MQPETLIAAPGPVPWIPPEGWTRRASIRADAPEATAVLAERLAALAAPGAAFLLSGDLGAGKTHFARHFIRRAMGPAGAHEDIPSPSFTLVQTYALAGDAGDLWHVDLYRLGGPDALVELGLDEALEAACCLIEWPERMAPHWPEGAVMLRFEPVAGASDTARRIVLWAPEDSALADAVAAAFGTAAA